MFKTYQEAEQFVTTRRKSTRKHSFEDFCVLLEKLGNPQDSFKSIHVAGTNGKGSTSNYISDILQTKYSKVGLFTSPHLMCHRDRIRINNEWISEEKYLQYLNECYEMIIEQDLAMFEIVTLIACLYFRDEKVDYAVMEVGIGGRIDPTNALHHPSITVITSIGYDHMKYLGNTLEEIAREKAGIIKKDIPIVVGEIKEDIVKVIQDIANKKEAPFYQTFSYEDIGERKIKIDRTTYILSTSAMYQKKNVALALKVVSLLGIDIQDEMIKETVHNSLWLGRFEHIKENVIIDGAHNEEGIEALVSSFHYLERPIVVIFTALNDKRGREMAKTLKKNADYLILTEIENKRATNANDLSSVEDEIITDWKEAYHYAKEYVKEKGTIVFSGSLYLISEVREYLINH